MRSNPAQKEVFRRETCREPCQCRGILRSVENSPSLAHERHLELRRQTRVVRLPARRGDADSMTHLLPPGLPPAGVPKSAQSCQESHRAFVATFSGCRTWLSTACCSAGYRFHPDQRENRCGSVFRYPDRRKSLWFPARHSRGSSRLRRSPARPVRRPSARHRRSRTSTDRMRRRDCRVPSAARTSSA